MITVYPAIDLKDGQCVRLFKGEMSETTVYSDNPPAQAKSFEDTGCQWLHIVDLNGAFEGEPVNRAAVEGILDTVSIPLQLGGGIRDVKTIGRWIDLGVSRIILGTVAVKDPAVVKEACKSFPGQIAVGIDARDGWVAVEGWAETSDIRAEELAKRFEDAGVAAIIHTDIDRDGTMAGANVEASAELASHTSIPVIVSGGVRAVDDIIAVEKAGTLEGVISGRAIYDGSLDLVEALKAAKGNG